MLNDTHNNPHEFTESDNICKLKTMAQEGLLLNVKISNKMSNV